MRNGRPGQQHAHAYNHQVSRAGPFKNGERGVRCGHQRADAQRGRKDVNEAARRDTQRRNHAGARARTQGIRHDVEHVRAGREVQQQAGRNEKKKLAGVHVIRL